MGEATTRRVTTAVLRTGAIAVLMACVTSSVEAAWAKPLAGGTYAGRAADGATVSFTVSRTGKRVVAYRIAQAPGRGRGRSGPPCIFTGQGNAGIWPGASIVRNGFRYRFYSAILFQGTFSGAHSAVGKFRFASAATKSTRACDTGTVTFRVAVVKGRRGR